jgi:hypothetical protein
MARLPKRLPFSDLALFMILSLAALPSLRHPSSPEHTTTQFRQTFFFVCARSNRTLGYAMPGVYRIQPVAFGIFQDAPFSSTLFHIAGSGPQTFCSALFHTALRVNSAIYVTTT